MGNSRVCTKFGLIFLLSCSTLCAEDVVQLQPYQRQLTLTGFTEPKNEKIVSSEVGARCKAVYVDLGDSVPSDGLVAELDPTFKKIAYLMGRRDVNCA